MRSGKPIHQAASIALLLHLVAGIAAASPLSTAGDPTALPAEPARAPASAEKLVQSDSWIDTSPSEPLLVPSPSARATVRESPGTATATSWDAADTIGAPLSDRSLSEQLRDFVQVEPRRPGPGMTQTSGRGMGRGIQSGPSAPDFAGVDLGAAAEEWVRETMQSLIHSTLRLDVNESGRASFSVLGFGEFTVTLSGDRSRIALAEGGDVLLMAQRSQEGAGSRADAGRADAGAPLEVFDDEPHIWRAIALVADVAGHPVSLLVYCVIAAYVLLWSVFSRQQQARRADVPASAGASVPAVESQVRVRRSRKPRRRDSLRLVRIRSERTRSAKRALVAEPVSTTTASLKSPPLANPSLTNPSLTSLATDEPSTPAVTPPTTLEPAGAESGSTRVRRRKRIRVRIRTRIRRTLSSHRA